MVLSPSASPWGLWAHSQHHQPYPGLPLNILPMEMNGGWVFRAHRCPCSQEALICECQVKAALAFNKFLLHRGCCQALQDTHGCWPCVVQEEAMSQNESEGTSALRRAVQMVTVGLSLLRNLWFPDLTCSTCSLVPGSCSTLLRCSGGEGKYREPTKPSMQWVVFKEAMRRDAVSRADVIQQD